MGLRKSDPASPESPVVSDDPTPTATTVFQFANGPAISFTASTPVDYTDGTPPATGEGSYAKGSLVCAMDTGMWYFNNGTAAEPAYLLLGEQGS